MPRSFYRRLPVLMLFSYWTLLFLGTHIPSRSGGIGVSDKFLHFTAYAGLAVLLMAAIAPHRRPLLKTLLVLAALSTYGLIDELLQIPIPTRHCDAVDLLADVAGCVAGLTVFWCGFRLLSDFAARRAMAE